VALRTITVWVQTKPLLQSFQFSWAISFKILLISLKKVAQNPLSKAGKWRSALPFYPSCHAMLATAERSIRRSQGRGPRRPEIVLRQGLAEDLDARRMFGRDGRFNTIFFAYSLSMMPNWQQALRGAFANLEPGGTILVVDFWDQKDLPAVFATGLRRWLSLFGVEHRPEVHEALVDLGRSGRAEIRIEAIARRYAYLATIRTRSGS
jgi:S-adenosylmethionine-diacylgycerolhomoserine-N-methlytransferase